MTANQICKIAGYYFRENLCLIRTNPYRSIKSFLLSIDFHGNNNPQFYTFDLQSFA